MVFFATPHYGPAYDAVERVLSTATGAPHVVGCSARGLVGEGGTEGSAGVTAVALAGDFEVERFFLRSLRGRSFEIGREIGRRASALESERRSVLLLADSYNFAPDELLAGVGSVAPEVQVIGGGATEDGSTGETTVVWRGTSGNYSVAGLLLGGVGISTAIARSALPVSTWWTVTEAECHRILALDGRPALSVFLESLPQALVEEPAGLLGAVLVGLADPSEGGDSPPHVVRRLVGLDPHGEALLVGDEVIPGSRLALLVRDREAARRSLEASIEDVLAGEGRLAGAIYFNDIERGAGFHGIEDLDAAYLRRSLGEIPFAGFFSSLELAPMGGRNRFHQYAGVLAGLYDREPPDREPWRGLGCAE